jgi:hypothetical protein
VCVYVSRLYFSNESKKSVHCLVPTESQKYPPNRKGARENKEENIQLVIQEDRKQEQGI